MVGWEDLNPLDAAGKTGLTRSMRVRGNLLSFWKEVRVCGVWGLRCSLHHLTAGQLKIAGGIATCLEDGCSCGSFRKLRTGPRADLRLQDLLFPPW